MRFLILALALVATPAAASAKWDVEEYDNGCFAAASYPRGEFTTDLSLGRSVDGRSAIVLKNPAWSTVKDKVYDVYLLIDDEFLSGKATGLGGGALSMQIQPEVMVSLSKASRFAPALKIDENNEKVLEAMNLRGSADAIDRVEACVANMVKRRAERAAADPFRP